MRKPLSILTALAATLAIGCMGTAQAMTTTAASSGSGPNVASAKASQHVVAPSGTSTVHKVNFARAVNSPTPVAKKFVASKVASSSTIVKVPKAAAARRSHSTRRALSLKTAAVKAGTTTVRVNGGRVTVSSPAFGGLPASTVTVQVSGSFGGLNCSVAVGTVACP